jgi:hypothetical protein
LGISGKSNYNLHFNPKNMLNKYKWLNWIAFAVFALGFILSNEWLSIEFIQKPYYVWMMLGATVVSFVFGSQMRWLGICIVAFGYALGEGYITLNMGSTKLNHVWIMLTGYLTVFFSGR